MVTGSCIFVAHGFHRENTLLQPWRYLFELAVRFSSNQRVVVITDTTNGEAEEIWMENLTVIRSNLLSVRRQNAMASLINSYSPTHVWWSTTPRSVAYLPILKRISCPVTALITCPLYPWKLLIQAWLRCGPFEELRALLQQRLVPRWLFANMLSNRKVLHVITQSQANRNLLIAAGVPDDKVKVIPVGIDQGDRSSVPVEHIKQARTVRGFPEDALVFLYLGAARPIRGIYALLDAFPLAAMRAPNIYLGVLARGADEKLCSELRARCERFGIADRVQVVGGWLTREQVLANIEACDVVTLPFILVPSDVPIAVLEAMARGKPVITSAVDGIPELVRGRGIVVDPLDKQALAQAMLTFTASGGRYREMAKASQQFMETYPDWNQIGEMAILIDK